uniref:LNR domain-containing protein n=1 Tax=Macrostomum lignano TaxID=282301 RepID=A0A1I8FMT3_9PLAT
MTTAASACGGYREGLNTGQRRHRNNEPARLAARDYLQITDGSSVHTCPNKECVYQGSLCDNINDDCGCDDYGCDETQMLENSNFLTCFIICGFVEMPERKRPECMRRRENQTGGCLGRCGAKNKVQQQAPRGRFHGHDEKDDRWEIPAVGGRRFGRVHHSKQQSPPTSPAGAPCRSAAPSAADALRCTRQPTATRLAELFKPRQDGGVADDTRLPNAAPQTEQKPPGPVTLAVPKSEQLNLSYWCSAEAALLFVLFVDSLLDI